MKKLILTILFLIIPSIASAGIHYMSLGSTSGNSTAPSGTSDFYTAGVTLIEKQGYGEGGCVALQIKKMDINKIAVADSAYDSGTTIDIYLKTSWFDDADIWNAANKIYIVKALPVSGNTGYMFTSQIPPFRFLRAYVDSGITGFYDIDAELFIGNVKGWKATDSQFMESMVFNLTATTGVTVIYAGVSRFGNSAGDEIGTGDDNGISLPDGANYGYLFNSSSSGNSIYVTKDNKAFNRDTSPFLEYGKWMPLNRNELEMLQLGAGAACTAILELYSRKPE